eukprot:8094687-Ditylum_brightwellii.AAC.1
MDLGWKMCTDDGQVLVECAGLVHIIASLLKAEAYGLLLVGCFINEMTQATMQTPTWSRTI